MNDPARPRPAIDPTAVPWSRAGAAGAPAGPRTPSGGTAQDQTAPAGGAGAAGTHPAAAQSRRPAPALWWVVAGVVLATVVALTVDTKLGIAVLATTCLAAGVARAVVAGPGPEGITNRSRSVDVTLFLGAAAVLVFLAAIAPAA
ncbi:Protein of unknown function (DUF3017) [Sediminihabitans luteus]|uniref:DUF3017 family protein n=1 Tax=Sediminihabitans luteus TaxID=1138585 RepID=A0A2M9CZ62_9CELL|nr:DUF3017 domain-containing protein [Sediminihabitans luteus]PJJ77143.1 Protein of unknown function (DUF3017) [Sediminihabitans luteus]GII98591.1 hypothetical protein Slu03_09690 [Sediminihabitans luteus]